MVPGGDDPLHGGRGGVTLRPETPLNPTMMKMKTPTPPCPARQNANEGFYFGVSSSPCSPLALRLYFDKNS